MSAFRMMRGQRRFFRLVDEYRLLAILARRQYGKTTTFAKIALKKMMKKRNHTVIFGSAKLNLSREIARKESEILQAAIAEAIEQAKTMPGKLRVADATSAKLPDKLTPDDFAELFEAQRLEFRYFHTPASYSRTKVVALRADTVGETGDLMCDEIGRVAAWRDVWEAVSPIIARDPSFRLCLSTTPPPDDTHYSFDMLAPPVGMEFKPNPEGTLYESEMGVTVLRVDAWDAAADGLPIYDLKTGEPLTPEQSRARERDKDAWDRNFGCLFVVGGVGACGLLQLDTAQRRGIGKCVFVQVESDSDFDRALRSLPAALGEGVIGIGADLATTTKATSNPTAVAIAEQVGVEYNFPLILTWKTSDPHLAGERIRRIVETVAKRSAGGRARRLAVDATNERYFAKGLRDSLAPLLPVALVVGSETVERPGYEPMTTKQFLGSMLIGLLDDNRLTLPPDRYIRDDWRLVKKERGALVCEPEADGKHGDTFDAVKLAIHAIASGGAAEAEAAAVGSYGSYSSEYRDRFPPRPDHSADSRAQCGAQMI